MMKLLIAGDFCQKYRLDQAIRERQFDGMLGSVKPLIAAYDYSLVNFEFPIVRPDAPPAPIQKCGPNLKGTIEAAEAVHYAGFKACTLANNHILDQGEQCGLQTKEALEQAGIDTVGFGQNEEDAAITLFKEIGGETLAVINCCEHEFSVATRTTAGSNGLNPVRQYYAISEARAKADYVVVIVHGGHEMHQLPSPRMQETYRFFIEVGADAVINHHQHCYSGYEIYQGKPIFYGLGNFCFDNLGTEHGIWNEGFMVGLTLKKGTPTELELIPYNQCDARLGTRLMNDVERAHFDDEVMRLCDIILDKDKLQEMTEKYYNGSAAWELSIMEPYHTKIGQKLLNMGLLPRWVIGNKLSAMLNHTACESHRDKLLHALTLNNKR